MANKRYVNTRFWDDTYVSELDPSEKLLFLYFLTNSLTLISGIYEIPLKRISLDTGFDKEMVLKILARFTRDKKIYYLDGWIYIKNFEKHQSTNPSVLEGIKREKKALPPTIAEQIDQIDRLGTDWVQPVPLNSTLLNLTLPNSTTPNEREVELEKQVIELKLQLNGIGKDEEKEKSSVKKEKEFPIILDYFNLKASSSLRPTSKKRTQLISRLKTFTVDEIKKAIDNRAEDEWMSDSKFLGSWESLFRNDEQVDKWLNKKQDKKDTSKRMVTDDDIYIPSYLKNEKTN